MDEEIVNPFPSPPSHYKLYTKQNLNLLSLLRSRTSTVAHDSLPVEKQREVLHDQGALPSFDLTVLEKPRADWIIEDGGYETFGDFWPIPERHPTLEEGGLTQLYPKSSDHRPALQKLLHTLLLSYHSLIGALLIPPPSTQQSMVQEPEWTHHIEWIQVVSLNMIAAVNELRPAQARGTLELALSSQLASRREETKAIHAKCDELSATLESLRKLAQESRRIKDEAEGPKRMLVEGEPPSTIVTAESSQTVSTEESSMPGEDVDWAIIDGEAVRQWAEDSLGE